MKKILVIEDDRVILSVYRTMFEQEGFETQAAEDGLVGMKQLSAFKPDLVVLDLMLPKMNGIDVLKFIRSTPALKQLPVVVFSNAYLSEMTQQGANSGATLGVIKSTCTPERLLTIVQDLLAGKSFPPEQATSAKNPGGLSTAATPENPASISQATGDSAADPKSADPVLRSLAGQTAADVATLKRSCTFLAENENSPLQFDTLVDVEKRIRSLAKQAGVLGLRAMADFTSAIDALLLDLQASGENITPSALLTLSTAVDVLQPLLQEGETLPPLDVANFQILAVDDDPVCAQAIVMALGTARLSAVTTDDPGAGMKLIQENVYDLLMLDANLPGTTGYQLCTRIRHLPAYKQTPVIFVTGHVDFQSHARAKLSGATDLIAKPFLPLELAVKVLAWLLKGHISAKMEKKNAVTERASPSVFKQ